MPARKETSKNSQLLPEELRIWATHLTHQVLRQTPKERAFKWAPYYYRNKEPGVNWHRSIHHSYPNKDQQHAHFSLSWARSDCVLFHLLTKTLVSTQTAFKHSVRSSCVGHWWVLGHFQLLRATKNNDNGFDNHKGLRVYQELGRDSERISSFTWN